MQLEGYSTCCLKTVNERHFMKSSKLLRRIWIYFLQRNSVALSIVLLFLRFAWTHKLYRWWWHRVLRSMHANILRKLLIDFHKYVLQDKRLQYQQKLEGGLGMWRLNSSQLRLQWFIQLLLVTEGHSRFLQLESRNVINIVKNISGK